MTRLVPVSVAFGLALAAGLLPVPASATTLAYSTGLASPVTTIDFSGVADGTEVAGTFAAQGVTFNGLFVTSHFGNTLSPTTAPAAANFDANTTNATFGMSFSSVVSDVAFFLDTDGFGATITSMLNGVAVESVTAARYASNGADFFGFTDSAFDSISVTVSGLGTAVIDNVELGNTPTANIPEPGSSALILMGLAGMMALHRRMV